MPADHLCLGITHTLNWICWTLKKTCQKLVLTPCSRQQKWKVKRCNYHTQWSMSTGIVPGRPSLYSMPSHTYYVCKNPLFKIITFHHILEFELWVMIEVHFSFYYTSYRRRYCENKKERKLNKDSIKTQTLPIKFEVWSTVSYLDENGIKFIIFVMSSIQVD